MKFEMKTKALRFLSDIQTGPFGSQLHKEDYVDDGTPIVTVEHLGNRVFTEQNLPRVSNEDKQRLSKYILKEGDIVFSRVGSVDRCSFVDSQHTDWLFSGRCLRVHPFEEISPLFLYYFFCLESTKKFMRNIAVGATMPSINTKLMGEIEVSYPDKQVQEKIANLLGAIDDKIELNNAINDNLLAQAQTLYKQFFPYGVQDDLPDGWRIGTVGEIIEIHDSKRIPLSGADRSKMEKKIYPYYGAASLMDLVDNYIFDGKYLLLGEDGTVVDDAGYPILQYVWGQFWVNNHAHILTGRLGYDVESLYMLFKQTPVKSIVTGAVQPKISQANLRSVQVVIPPEHNLREYNDLVEPLFSLFRANEEECKTFTALRDTLLPKLMSGEIDVSAVQL